METVQQPKPKEERMINRINKTFYITESELKEVTSITENVDSKHLVPYFHLTQKFDIDPLLGRDLAACLVSELQTKRVVLAATQMNPVQITTDSSHPYVTGDSILIEGSTGMPEINGEHVITVTSDTTFTLDGLDGTGFGLFTVGSAEALRMPLVNRLLLKEIIFPYAYWTMYQAVPHIWMQFRNKSVLKRSSENSELPSKNDIVWYRGTIQNTAESFSQLLVEFLRDNASDYPKYKEECGVTKTGWRKQIRF